MLGNIECFVVSFYERKGILDQEPNIMDFAKSKIFPFLLGVKCVL
jgi:hypothetical protein